MEELRHQDISNSQFEIVKQIGHGQFSNVYQARWHNSAFQQRNLVESLSNTQDRTQYSSNSQQSASNVAQNNDQATIKPFDLVALKHIKLVDIHDAKLREDCLKEVHLLQRLHHPNIINYRISFIERNDLYIVLELADGGDLCKLINYFSNRGCLIIAKTILKYFTQICSAVKYIHSERILHRDIKPANIFMTSKGIVKLGDFGLGRFFSNNTFDAHSLVGTFYYMSPERIQRTGYSFSSDVWSLGCVLYELITLHSPFSKINYDPRQPQRNKNNSPINQPQPLNWLINRICNAEYPSLDGYDNICSELKVLVYQCLRPQPEDRPDMIYICKVVETSFNSTI